MSYEREIRYLREENRRLWRANAELGKGLNDVRAIAEMTDVSWFQVRHDIRGKVHGALNNADRARRGQI